DEIISGLEPLPGYVLRASGVDFAPKEFWVRSSFNPCSFSKRRTSRRFIVLADVWLTVEVSRASDEKLGKQIKDGLEFLNTYRDELTRLLAVPLVTDLALDFGV